MTRNPDLPNLTRAQWRVLETLNGPRLVGDTERWHHVGYRWMNKRTVLALVKAGLAELKDQRWWSMYYNMARLTAAGHEALAQRKKP